MDTPDRTASKVPFAAMPEQVVDAINQWIGQVVALAAGSLTAAQAADVVDRAAPLLAFLPEADRPAHADRLLSIACG